MSYFLYCCLPKLFYQRQHYIIRRYRYTFTYIDNIQKPYIFLINSQLYQVSINGFVLATRLECCAHFLHGKRLENIVRTSHIHQHRYIMCYSKGIYSAGFIDVHRCNQISSESWQYMGHM